MSRPRLPAPRPLAAPLLRTASAAALLVVALLAPAATRAEEDAPAMEMAGSPAADPVASAEAPAFKPLRLPLPADQIARSNYGMSVFLWNNPTTTERDLTTLQTAGIGWQKTLFQWREIEGRGKFQYDWREADRVVAASNKAGIKILARIDFSPTWTRKDGEWKNARPDRFQDWTDFLRNFADRYRAGSPHGQVQAIEIWNEPNLQREWGTPISQKSAADYVEMLKLSYGVIKQVDPSMLVVTAGLSPTGWDDDTARPDDAYLQWMFDAGARGYYDVLGVHGNGQAPDPTAEPGSMEGFAHPSFYFRRVEQLRAIQERNGDSKPMWLLEFGWTSDQINPQYAWFAVSEEKKAENLLAAVQYARQNWPWMQVMTFWTLPDPQWRDDREEYWWALANRDGTPRPALDRLIDAAQAGALP